MNFSNNHTEARGRAVECEQCACEHDKVTFTAQCFVEPLVLLVGITVDMLALLVLTRRAMRSSTSMYLIAMTTYDVCYLLLCCSNYWKGCSYSLPEPADYHWYHRYVGEPSMTLFSNNTTVTICLLSVERYVAVCRPHHFAAWAVVRFSQKLIVGAFLLTLLTTVPEFFRNDYDAQMDKLGYEWIEDAVFTYVPIVFLIVCNTRIVYALCKESKLRLGRRRISVSNGQVRASESRTTNRLGFSRLTVRLVVIVAVFVVCALPAALLSSYHGYASFSDKSMLEEDVHIFNSALQLCSLLNPINAIANFIVYVAMSKHFRQSAKELCQCGDKSEYKRGKLQCLKRWKTESTV